MCSHNPHPIVTSMASLLAKHAANGESVTEADLSRIYSPQEVRDHIDAARRLATRSMTRTIHRPRPTGLPSSHPRSPLQL